ncbi:MAG: YbhN family protein [Anaerolineae bacterium]
MKRLSRLLVLLILGLLTLLLLLKLGDIDISVATLRRIDPVYLIIAIAVHYSGFAVRGWRWQKLLAGLNHRLSFTYTTALLMSGWFVSALIPARLGDVARATMLRRDHSVPLARGFASIAAERALDILAILSLAAVASVWALAGRTPGWMWQTIAGGATLFGAALVLLLAAPKLELRLLTLLPWTMYRRVMQFGFDLLDSIRQLGRRPGVLALVAGQSVYIWLCDVFLMYFVFLSIGSATGLSISAFTSMAVDLAAAVPVIPGALGQVEGTAVGVLALFNIDPRQSSLMILLNRFISFWTFIIASGVVTYLFGFSQALNPHNLRAGRSPVASDNL